MRITEKGSWNPAVLSPRQRSLLTLLIEAPYYSAQAAINFSTPEELVQHYLQVGWRKGLDPSPTFQSTRYLDVTPGLREAGKNPFVHFLFEVVGEDALVQSLAGISGAEISEMRAHFDADWYIRNNPEVEKFLADPLVHYLTFGWRELRDPSPLFSTASYRDIYPDVHDCGINPFYHWVLHGIDEGRSSGKAPSAILDSWDNLNVGQQSILVRMYCVDYYRSKTALADCDDYHRGLLLAKQVSSGRPNAGRPTPSFDASKHVAAHPESMGQVPFLHYLFEVVGEDALRGLFVAQPPIVLQAICDHFDTAWYIYNYPDVEASGQDALIHYMTVGWRKNYDPSREFSTRAYLLRHADVVEAGLMPFVHWVTFGRLEGRLGASSAQNFRNRLYAPSITAILINHKSNLLTPNCIAAVRKQSYADLGILVVGAPLSDDCRTALTTSERGGGASFSYEAEDGLVPLWKLLQRAVEHAPGDLLWFVQGRGVHHFEFLARLTSSFSDGSVQLGFGRRLGPDDANYAVAEDELAQQMEGWTRHATTPAALWFTDQLRPDLLAADQHSFLWRQRRLGESVWRHAGEYQYLGLWHLFLHMASGGQIATVRDAVMRFPTASATSIARRNDDVFLKDVTRLSAEVQSFWSLPSVALGASPKAERIKRHVLIVTHGIFAGGAENLPIQLANELAGRGVIVSMLVFRTEMNAEMRATLDPGVSIYEADWVLEYGCEKFVRDIGCSLIHSHGVVGEMFFFRLCEKALPVPYIATLHGSYEAATSQELPELCIAKIVRSVDLFVYTADKNLGPLLRHGVRPEKLTKMINAMPVDGVAFPRSRAELGIAEDALVFTLVARGVREKGWSTAINAFKSIRKRNPHRTMHLCLVGEGDEPERLKPLHADDPSISFLGFQLRIHGLYRMTDVAIVPTRFAGESFPLCIIQALQAGVPVIATDVGEIASMLEVNGVAGGVVVEESQIDDQFDARFADAMLSLVDDERRRRLGSGASVLGEGYDMGAFTDHYIALYEDVLRRFAASRPALPADRIEPNTEDAA